MTSQKFTAADANVYVGLIFFGFLMLCIGLGFMLGAAWFFVSIAAVFGGFGTAGLLLYHAQKRKEEEEGPHDNTRILNL